MSITRALEVANGMGVFFAFYEPLLKGIFYTNIPKSLLPYPADEINEAYNLLYEVYSKAGDTEKAKACQTLLIMFDFDEAFGTPPGDAKVLQLMLSTPDLVAKYESNLKKVGEKMRADVYPKLMERLFGDNDE
jgi:hypothetical protein